TWYHLAVDRDESQTLRVYVDGNILINSAVPAALHNSSADLKIGTLHAGWIDEVRITKGVARYQGAFTQPNRQATADDVVLMTHLDSADGATTADDESNSGHSLTFAGGAQIDSGQSRFGGASAVFNDLQTSFVSASDSDDWHFGAGEFTVEGRVRFSSLGSYSAFAYQYDSASNQISWLLDWTASSQLRFLFSPDGTNASRVTLAAPWSPSVNTWYHLAVDRDSSRNLRVYVDGNVLINTEVPTAFHDSSADVRLGTMHAGWLDDVRITKGAAQYAGPFTPAGRTPDFADVVLLSHLDGADGATLAVDQSDGNHALTFAGAAQIDIAQSRFGGASAVFDDAGTSFVSAADSADWHFGAGEFTVEAWVRFGSRSSYAAFIYQYDSAHSQISWLVDWTTADQIRFLYSPDGTNASRVTLAAPWAPAVDTWYHVAVERDAGKQLRVYVDGAVVIDTHVAASFHDSSADLRLGTLHAGWIDEVRITKGVAQYGGAFTPSDEPHPDAALMVTGALQ
ncbi:MAG: LamG-like jellyroll fold domain-containing protein, partial [Alphaproteobacteria bacterium]